MNTFRVLALAYALSAVLIAPSWLEADTVGTDESATPTQEPAPAPAAEPAQPTEPAPAPAAAPADEAPVATAQQAEEPTTEPKTTATAAKDEKQADEPVAHVAGAATVTISDFKFSPASVTVNIGDTVTWTNNGPTAHTATAKDGSFDTGLLNKGDSGSHTFSSAGTFAYICTPHPFMKGTIVVQGATAGSGGSSSGSDTSDTSSSGSAGEAGNGLPSTGGDTALIALLGLLTLAAGLWLRRGPRTTSRT